MKRMCKTELWSYVQLKSIHRNAHVLLAHFAPDVFWWDTYGTRMMQSFGIKEPSPINVIVTARRQGKTVALAIQAASVIMICSCFRVVYVTKFKHIAIGFMSSVRDFLVSAGVRKRDLRIDRQEQIGLANGSSVTFALLDGGKYPLSS